jgi:hypothetical protein
MYAILKKHVVCIWVFANVIVQDFADFKIFFFQTKQKIILSKISTIQVLKKHMTF